MTLAVLIFLSLIGLILQSTVFNSIAIAGVKPDFILILVIFYSIIRGNQKGAAVGFLLGLIEDVYLGRFIGMNALAKGLTGFAAGILTRGAFSDNLFVPIITTFLGTLLNGFIFLVLGKTAGLQWAMSLWLWKAVPMAIYNACLVPFIYSWFYDRMTKPGQETKFSTFWGKNL